MHGNCIRVELGLGLGLGLGLKRVPGHESDELIEFYFSVAVDINF